MRVSPSQETAYEDQCRRKWWFRSVHKLLEPPRGFQAYGIALHAVIERYLKGDPTNYELYPEGWQTVTDKRTGVVQTLLPSEAAQIQRLIPRAIEKGILWRPPEVQVETEYSWTLPGGLGTEIGVIDFMTEEAIRDHKSTSNKRYAKSPAVLKTDLQMGAYAARLRRLRLEAGYPDIPIGIGHNVFIKDERAEDVILRETVLTPEDLIEHESRVLTIVEGMIQLKDVAEDDWKTIDVKAQVEKTDACNAYGGCPYREICHSGSTPALYRARIGRVTAAAARAKGGGGMSILKALGKKDPTPAQQLAAVASTGKTNLVAELQGMVHTEEAQSVSAEVVDAIVEKVLAEELPPPAIPFDQPAPINPPAITVASGPVGTSGGEGKPELVSNPQSGDAMGPVRVPEETAGGISDARSLATVPPWHNTACVACRTNPYPGFGTNARPCKVCDSAARRAGKPTSEDFRPTIGEDGVPRWVAPQAPVVHAPAADVAVGTMPAPQGVASAVPAPAPAGSALQPSRPDLSERSDEAQGERATPPPAPAAPVPPDAVAAVPEGKRRGRPKGAPNKPKVDGAEVLAYQKQLEDELREARATIADLGEELQEANEALSSGSPTIGQLAEAAVREGMRVELKLEGFTLLIGCRAVRGAFEQQLDFGDLVRAVQEKLAKAQSVESYFDLDTWKRRDAISQNAREIVRELLPPGTWLVAPTSSFGTPDEAVLLSALRPLATKVIE